LKKTYGKRGFEILGVPSSIFQNQEPTGDYTEIMNTIRYVRPGNGFVPEFPLFSRVDVAGKNKIPLYAWATSRCPAPNIGFRKRMNLLYEEMSAEDIRWNFEKILFDHTGQPFKRYGDQVLPLEVEKDIEYLLKRIHVSFPLQRRTSSPNKKSKKLFQPYHQNLPKARNFVPPTQRFPY